MNEKQIAAMRQALEALKSYHGYMEPLLTVFGGPRVPAEQSTTAKVEKAITALRQVLTDQALDKMAENARELGLDYEPVAWMYPDDYERMTTTETFCTVYSVEVGSATRGESTVALYTHPVKQPTEVIDPDSRTISVYEQPSILQGWIAVSDRLPLESDGEVLVRMRDGRCEIAWATYWHGASNAFAQWTFRDPDEDEAPTHWMPLPAAPTPQGE